MTAAGSRTGVVLSGGASYGAYEVGVMKALAGGLSSATSYLPLRPALFCGTSVGAYNSAALVAKSDFPLTQAVANLERIWMDEIASSPGKRSNGVVRIRGNLMGLLESPSSGPLQQVRDLFSGARVLAKDSLERGREFFRSSAPFTERALELIDLEMLISADPFRRLVETSIELDSIRSSRTGLRISATNWLNGEVHVFGNRDMIDGRGHDIVRASGALPGLFPPVEIDGTPYADGGVVLNTPLRPAIEAGADIVHMVSVNPELSVLNLPPVSSTVNTFYRLMAISLAGSVNRDIEIAARLNDGIAYLQAAQSGSGPPHAGIGPLALTLGGLANRPRQDLPYRPLTIHRHHLTEDFANFSQWLDFDRDRIAWLIEKGARDAMAHDCRASGCIIP